MQCQKHKELLERWWNDRLTEAERAGLEAQLSECEDCRRELEGSREIWELMSHMPVPEPTPKMQVEFDAMLEHFKEVETGKKKGLSAGIAALWQVIAVRPGLAVAFGAVLLLVGFGSGLLINREKTVTVREPVAGASTGAGTIAAAAPRTEQVKSAGGDTAPVLSTRQAVAVPTVANEATDGKASGESKQLEELTAQVHEMRELMMLSLLQNPSASERMRAVSYTSEIHRVNPKIAEALLTTLNNDPNVNVRLTTLEALTHFARDPIVREGLIQSILQQDSPLVQAAMADVMLKLQEKRSIQPFKKLLQQKDLNGMVRSKIEETITRLT
jgi:hypothetical protein